MPSVISPGCVAEVQFAAGQRLYREPGAGSLAGTSEHPARLPGRGPARLPGRRTAASGRARRCFLHASPPWLDGYVPAGLAPSGEIVGAGRSSFPARVLMHGDGVVLLAQARRHLSQGRAPDRPRKQKSSFQGPFHLWTSRSRRIVTRANPGFDRTCLSEMPQAGYRQDYRPRANVVTSAAQPQETVTPAPPCP